MTMTSQIPQQDYDAKCIVEIGNRVIEADVAYRKASLVDRIDLYQPLVDLHDEYTRARLKLLENGVICTEADVQKMKELRQEMQHAVKAQSVLVVILKLTALLRGVPYGLL